MTSDCFQDAIDCALSVRDQLGLTLKPVKRVTRTWSGTQPGDGTATELHELLVPSPEIKSLDHQVKHIEIGLVHQGDIEIRQVSKSQFPVIADVDGKPPSADRRYERLFDVGGFLYQVIRVEEKLYWWNIQLRRLTPQTRGEIIDG